MTKKQNFTSKGIDLSQPRLGTKILRCTDDFFAECSRMLSPDDPVFIDGKFDDNGKWMDGWESRRRRQGGNDSAIIKLGHPSILYGIDINTTHFTGNFPPAAALEACNSTSDPDENSEWVNLVPVTDLKGDNHHLLEINSDQIWTHLRLNIFPDGGIARLRIYGRIFCDWKNKDKNETLDLAAMVNGGRAITCNDAHFGQPSNLIAPGKGINMGDGWETRRRREPGNDWCILELGHRGIISEILIDTAFFKGNFPDRFSIQAADITDASDQSLAKQSLFWNELIPQQKLQMDREFCYKAEINDLGPVTHIMLNIFPDGGVSRLRLLGKIV